MSSNFHELLQEEAVAPPSERSTGLVLAAALTVVAIVLRANPVIAFSVAAVAAGLLVFALVAPKWLKPVNLAWFKFGQLIHVVMSPLIMGLLYLVAIVPLGLIMQRFRDPLRSKRDASATTYWVDRTGAAPTSMREQF